MKQVQLVVTVEIDDDTHPGCLEQLDYIEFGGRTLEAGWADLETEVGSRPCINSGRSVMPRPVAKLIAAHVVELEEVDEPRRCGMDG